MKKALVFGVGGFTGHDIVSKLKKERFWVRRVDLKYPGFSDIEADDFVIGDLRDLYVCRSVVDTKFD